MDVGILTRDIYNYTSFAQLTLPCLYNYINYACHRKPVICMLDRKAYYIVFFCRQTQTLLQRRLPVLVVNPFCWLLGVFRKVLKPSILLWRRRFCLRSGKKLMPFPYCFQVILFSTFLMRQVLSRFIIFWNIFFLKTKLGWKQGPQKLVTLLGL